MKNSVILLILLPIALLSCKDDDPVEDPAPAVQKVRVNIVPEYNGQTFELNTNYTTQEGYTIQFTKLNVIMTNFSNNGKELFKSGVYKFANDKKLLWEGEGDYASFLSMNANIGVTADQNHEDPSARPASDPLNILNTDDMHWGWNTGYIFLMIEGKADTSAAQNGQNMMTFLYHIGKDDFLRTVELSNLHWTQVSSTLHETNMYVDIYKVFDGDTSDVDIKLENSSHTMPSQENLSNRIISNFASAFSTE
ncbi:MAG: MbnP family protein [Brumimicrobium sp.]|nr:MbnP family protein [Brumimicrobium sp.]